MAMWHQPSAALAMMQQFGSTYEDQLPHDHFANDMIMTAQRQQMEEQMQQQQLQQIQQPFYATMDHAGNIYYHDEL
jgi:ethanolamine utilization protein EutQ (cupin superfamily)